MRVNCQLRRLRWVVGVEAGVRVRVSGRMRIYWREVLSLWRTGDEGMYLGIVF